MNNETLKLQTELKKAGFDPGPLDGLMGPKTRAALAARDAAERHGSGETLAARLVRVAREQLQLGIRETSSNRGPGIDKYWSATIYPDGSLDRQPWCAAFVCWCVREALFAEPRMEVAWTRPTTPAAFGFDEWARANVGRGVRYRVDPEHALPGDLVVFGFSHVGIVIGQRPDGDLLTIEGNTNAAGEREGGAVLAKVRPLSSVRSIHRFA